MAIISCGAVRGRLGKGGLFSTAFNHFTQSGKGTTGLHGDTEKRPKTFPGVVFLFITFRVGVVFPPLLRWGSAAFVSQRAAGGRLLPPEATGRPMYPLVLPRHPKEGSPFGALSADLQPFLMRQPSWGSGWGLDRDSLRRRKHSRHIIKPWTLGLISNFVQLEALLLQPLGSECENKAGSAPHPQQWNAKQAGHHREGRKIRIQDPQGGWVGEDKRRGVTGWVHVAPILEAASGSVPKPLLFFFF